MTGVPEPLLNLADFIRLVHSEIRSRLSRLQGLPPDLPPPPALAESSLSAWSPDLPALHGSIQAFFGLNSINPPEAGEKVEAYARRLRRAWLESSRQIIFHTSGSTGRPKPSPHSEMMLRQEMAAAAALFPGARRIAAAVPLLHSYGFVFGLLLPKALEIEGIDLPPLPGLLTNMLQPGDLLVGFPLLFSRLSGPVPATTRALSSTSPCPESLFEQMRGHGFEAFSEIYGSSETGAMAARFAPGPFELLSYWRRLDDDHLTREPCGGALPRLGCGPGLVYPLPDHLRWSGQRRFEPVGRRDQAVQVGGVNVYPGRVAELIGSHPQVMDCAVRLMGPEEGERLKAFVVPRPGADENKIRRELSGLFRSRLDPPERPGSLVFGQALPRSISGKAADWAIS